MSETPPMISGFVDVPAPHVPFGGSSDYMRMLREAQGESSARTSCRTSCRVSPIMSHNMSPKSPPNSPYNEREDLHDSNSDLSNVYINNIKDGEISDFIWDWSSRPNIQPPKQWKLHNANATKSPRSGKSDEAKHKTGFSTKIVFTFLLTNVLSLIIGAGIGMWLKKKFVKNMI